jgi:hypothetical protein|tara:strand:- start:649 stop:888 length:240 start_codon:yes stop_codon:yes gene_type:complete
MRNSYDIIFNNVLLKNFSNTYFMHNPNAEITDEVLMDMFKYFKSKKEWDKVVKITTLRAKIKFYDTTKRLSRAYSKQGD